MNIFYQPGLPDGQHYLDPEESRHCIKVLRRNEGDLITLTDGKGCFYTAAVTRADSRHCEFTITETRQEERRPYHIHIAISPTKNADRIEWFVEKSVELGVDNITLLECHNTERAFIKKERLIKLAVSAMKQSLKATLPRIGEPITFAKLIANANEKHRFIAYVDPENPIGLHEAAKGRTDAIILIGPEGDFTKEELDQAMRAGFEKVSLGKSRLRTETAGVIACHTLHLANA